MFGLNPWLILAAFLAILGAGAAGYGKGHSDAAATAAIQSAARDKAATEQHLKDLADKARIEHAFGDYRDKMENQHASETERIHGLRIANGRLIAAAGGLFDKNGKPQPAAGVPGPDQSAGIPQAQAAGCNLSAELSEFLQSEFERADEAAVYANGAYKYYQGFPAIKGAASP